MKIGMNGLVPTQGAIVSLPNKPASVTAQRPAGRDAVQISDLSRARLAELADSALAAEREEEASLLVARQQKLDDVREKISRGYYSNPDVLRKIAEKFTDNNGESL